MRFRWMGKGARAAAGAAAVLLGGCTLADVTVPASEDRLVVEAVLRTDVERQQLLLHRSVRDQASRGEPGADVRVTGPEGRVVVFQETEGRCHAISPAYRDAGVGVEVSCYTSSPDDGFWVRPGATYDLLIQTVRGEEARARTTVPGVFRLAGIPAQTREDEPEPACALPAETPLPLQWTPSPGAWGYLVPLTIYGLAGVVPPSFNAPDPLELVGLAVSASDTTIVLPGEFGVFERLDFNQDLLRLLQRGLPADTDARVVLAAADRNYINGVRGGNSSPSGQVRISSIVGDGVGVFGSLTPLRFTINVGSADGTPACLPG